MTDFVIVSAIFDLKRFHPGINRWRSAEKYIDLFKYIYDFNVLTILFVESHLYDKIIEKYHKRENFIVIVIDLFALPYYKLIPDGLPAVENGPHVDKYFCATINSKFYLLNKAKEYLFTNLNKKSHLVWLDCGIAHVGTPNNLCADIIERCYKDKITVCLMRAPQNNLDLNEFFKFSYGIVAAGIFIISSDMVEWYEKEYDKLFRIAIEKVMPYEEQVMGAMVSIYRNQFEYIFGDYGAVIRNLQYITVDMANVINNLTICRINNFHDTGMKIINTIIKSITQAKYDISRNDFMRFCYEAQIITFYMDRDKSIFFAKIITLLYHSTEFGYEYCQKNLDNIKQNLGFVGVNLLSDINEQEILDLDTNKILWRIL